MKQQISFYTLLYLPNFAPAIDIYSYDMAINKNTHCKCLLKSLKVQFSKLEITSLLRLFIIQCTQSITKGISSLEEPIR